MIHPFALRYLIALFCMILTAHAATRRVSTAAEFRALPTPLNAGDVVIVNAGVYADVDKTLRGTGTADRPVLVYANPPGSVYFSGNTRIVLDGTYVVFAGFCFDGDVATGGNIATDGGIIKTAATSSDCRITNVLFRNYNGGTSGPATVNWLNMLGYRHVVEYCSFEGKLTPGPTIAVRTLEVPAATAPRAHVFRHNYFGPRTGLRDNGDEPIRIGDANENNPDVAGECLVEYNLFYRALFVANRDPDRTYEREVISSKCSRNLFRRNTFIECMGDMSLRVGRNSTVEENYFFGGNLPATGGVGVMGYNHIVRNNYFQDVARAAVTIYRGTHTWVDPKQEVADNATIFHNTFVNCSQAFNVGQLSTGADVDPGTVSPLGVEFRNNVVQSNASGSAVFRFQIDRTLVAHSGNHVFHPNANYGTTGIPGVIYGPSPGLAPDAALGYWVPGGNSPILDAAVATTPPTLSDVRGLPRPVGGRLDIGSFEREVAGTGATVRPRNAVGPLFSGGPADTFQPPSSRLTNLSILARLQGSGDGFRLGFVVGGAGTEGRAPLLMRAAGPSLQPLGVTDALPNPKLELFAAATKVQENDNWGGDARLADAFSRVGAFPYTSPTSQDAALLADASGDHSILVSVAAPGATDGRVIAEIYDATAARTSRSPRLLNVSVLKQIGDGLTAGFVVNGNLDQRVLIRAVGPTLGTSPFNIPGTAADPRLVLFRGASRIAENNDWGGAASLSAAFGMVGAFALAEGSRDAALLAELAPGNYTVEVTNGSGAAGLVLVEVYEVP
jgi:hypothetical protein